MLPCNKEQTGRCCTRTLPRITRKDIGRGKQRLYTQGVVTTAWPTERHHGLVSDVISVAIMVIVVGCQIRRKQTAGVMLLVFAAVLGWLSPRDDISIS